MKHKEWKPWTPENYNYLYRYALNKLNDRELIQDLIQDTFLVALESYDRFGQRSAELTWLTAILKHKIYRVYRLRAKIADSISASDDLAGQERKYSPVALTSHDAEDTVVAKEFSNALRNYLLTMPLSWQQVYELRFVKGLEAGRICDALRYYELSASGLHNHMRDLRTLFNAARDRFNDEDRGLIRIKHYPFKKYKIAEAPLTAKRALTIDQLVKIRRFECTPGSRAELAKEIFMLSFYLCGMNAKDIYELHESDIVKNRINYNRSKTKTRRKDSAFISVKLIPEAALILFKHINRLQFRYADSNNFNKALSKGLQEIGEVIGIPSLTMYCARHSFGSLARNQCRFSKDDVAFALNHIDHTTKTTDIYIKPDWQIIDDVQLKVVSLLT